MSKEFMPYFMAFLSLLILAMSYWIDDRLSEGLIAAASAILIYSIGVTLHE